ncbi:MAG: aminotransferase class V-fold PLP-dependent enzyme [Deltaproteobacteria bacterium]|nr:MAG: aminotransferase class V-fold PLP-dependent enzyme [Deltaproteobacteria bacterium]
MHRFRFFLHTLTGRSLPFLQPFWGTREWSLIARCLAGASLPGQVSGLEAEVARLTRSRYALGLNLGRSAIQVALEAFRFPKGSEVILPSFSCAGVVMPVLQAGLEPVLADVDRDFNLSLAAVEAALSPRTRAVILAHLSGKFARDTEQILELARAKGLKVIEDACQAFGLQKHGKWAGTFGDAGIFSFGLGKNLMGPGGGMLITDDEAVISYARSRPLMWEALGSVRLRAASFAARYGFPRAGFLGSAAAKIPQLCGASSPKAALETLAFEVRGLSEIEAALARCQVARHPEIISRRQANARALLSSGTLGGTGLDLPGPGGHIFTKFLLSTTVNPRAAVSLQEALKSRGIEIELSYTPLHLRPPFAACRRAPLTETERRWPGAFAVPVHPRLGRKEMERIIQVLANFSKQHQ